MSIAAWYEHKAEQCSRLAREATDARQRAQLMEEAALWREIARDLADRERSIVMRSPPSNYSNRNRSPRRTTRSRPP